MLEAQAGTAEGGNEKPAMAALIWAERSSSIAMLFAQASTGVVFQSASSSARPAVGGASGTP